MRNISIRAAPNIWIIRNIYVEQYVTTQMDIKCIVWINFVINSIEKTIQTVMLFNFFGQCFAQKASQLIWYVAIMQ